MSNEAIFKSVFATTLGIAALLCGSMIYFGYQSYTNPSQVYGSWIEINAPGYRTEVLTLNDQGVFRNHRLISTSFEYDGKNIKIETGQGRSIYALAGTDKSPQLKRIQPSSPIQRFIKQGFEDTIDTSGGAETRRRAITNHFEQN
ncbi:DUF2850 domain-containing protein [Vibrio ziniensis]|uniref:DUF2850 domain-containing protein n=1 Tax=Vibrio ziniensis TaxID=2711221 RepID=A0A6G7CNY3_9VIBR|nr:DUF2850 domain-containing protein [Vibrio ziniensis]QIH43847.1 DUF2850 domain-containing protein [Vibrio ziniensis]